MDRSTAIAAEHAQWARHNRSMEGVALLRASSPDPDARALELIWGQTDEDRADAAMWRDACDAMQWRANQSGPATPLEIALRELTCPDPRS